MTVRFKVFGDTDVANRCIVAAVNWPYGLPDPPRIDTPVCACCGVADVALHGPLCWSCRADRVDELAAAVTVVVDALREAWPYLRDTIIAAAATIASFSAAYDALDARPEHAPQPQRAAITAWRRTHHRSRSRLRRSPRVQH